MPAVFWIALVLFVVFLGIRLFAGPKANGTGPGPINRSPGSKPPTPPL